MLVGKGQRLANRHATKPDPGVVGGATVASWTGSGMTGLRVLLLVRLCLQAGRYTRAMKLVRGFPVLFDMTRCRPFYDYYLLW